MAHAGDMRLASRKRGSEPIRSDLTRGVPTRRRVRQGAGPRAATFSSLALFRPECRTYARAVVTGHRRPVHTVRSTHPTCPLTPTRKGCWVGLGWDVRAATAMQLDSSEKHARTHVPASARANHAPGPRPPRNDKREDVYRARWVSRELMKKVAWIEWMWMATFLSMCRSRDRELQPQALTDRPFCC